MNSIESTGKKLDDAIKAGLEQLGVTLDEVDVEIISSGGFLRKAKVRLTVIEKEDDLEELKNFTKTLADQSKKAEREDRAKEERRFESEQKRREDEQKKKEQQERRAAQQAKREEEKAKKQAELARIVALEEERQRAEQPEEEEEVSSIGEIKIVPDRPKTAKPASGKKENRRPKKEKAKREEKEYPPATDEQAQKAKDYVSGLIAAMGIEGEVEVAIEQNVISVQVITENAMVIGHRGETLDAIQALAKRVVESEDGHVRLVVDCKGYRSKREETLVRLAKKTADRCAKKGRKIALEPMDSMQRKIIHSALTDDERVFTKSDGKEPNRRVVIFPVRRNRG